MSVHQVSAGTKEIQALQAAGFDGEQIVDWRAQKQAELSQAGFNDAEINGYFGKPETDMQPISDLFWANMIDAGVQPPIFETATPPRSPELIEAQAEAGAAVRERLRAEGFEPIETIGDALEAGWEISSIGLAAAGKMPDTIPVGDEPMYQRIAMQAATLTGDLPAMAAGFVIGGGAGVETGPGALITGTAGAFALPTAIRETLIDGYENGEFKDFGDFWERASGIFLETGKAWLTGAAAGKAGPVARGLVPEGAPLLAKSSADFAAQVTAMTTVGSALEGRIPTMQDFIDTAIVIGGLKGVVHVTRRLGAIYAETGVPPQQVMADIKATPLLRHELLSDRTKIPERYREAEVPAKTATGETLSLNGIQAKMEALGAEVRLSERPAITREGEKLVELSEIFIPEASRGEGVGSNAMRELTVWADQAGYRVVLNADSTVRGSKGSKAADNRLKKFYKQFGFVENKGKNKDFALGGPTQKNVMYRDPDLATKIEIPKTKPEPSQAKGEPLPEQTEVLSRISINEKQQRGYRFSDFYRDIVDDLSPLNKAVKEATGGRDKLPVMEDPYKLARLNRGVNGKAEHFLEYSPFKFETYENVGKSLKAILEPTKDRLDDVRAYVVARRSLELSERGIETGIPDNVSRATRAKLEKEMEPVAKELYAYQDHVVDYLVDSGVLSKDAAAAMREANRNYVPFFRVMDGESAGIGQGLATKQPVKRIKGSERRIVDPLESIIKNTYLFINLAERNAIADALWRVSEKFPDSALATLVKPKMTPTNVTQAEILRANPEVRDIVANYDNVTVQDFSVFRPNSFVVEKDQIAVYREGKRHILKVDEKVARVFQGLDVESSNALVNILSVPAKFLRAGAILSPEFVGRNPIRDQLSAFVFSKAGFKPFLDLAHGIYSMVKKDQHFKDWLKSGGPNSTLVSLDRNYLQKNVRELSGQMGLYDYVVNVVRSPVEALRVLSDLSERGTRIGEFARTVKGRQGKEAITEGGFASREITLDFQRIGAKTRAVNSLIAFWNANVQGTDKLIRAFRDQPALTAAKIAGGITLPSVVLYLINRDDPEWDDIPRWQKDLFWLVHVGDTWWRIPKPFELGIIFGTGAERLVEKILDDDGHAFDGFLKAMGRGSTPGFMPTAMAPVIEAWANKSLFLDRPIIPHDRENVLPEYQYKPYTTEVAKALGKLIGMFPVLGETKAASPAIIENYVQAWTGGLGMHALRAADLALRKTGILPDPVKPATTLADIPFVKGFVVRYPSAGSENIQRFYDSYDQQQQFINTIKVLIADNRPDEALKIMNQAITEGDLLQLGGIRQGLTNSMKFIRLVHKNPDMTSDEKRQIIDTTYYQMSKMAELGNEIVEQGKKAAKANAELNQIAVQ